MEPHVIIFLLLLLSAPAPSSPTHILPPPNPDLLIAAEEMQRAQYFAFVMLINMAPPALFYNLTFLMPTDRALSQTLIPPGAPGVVEFLLRHSIPSTLLFNHLDHLPSGSLLPTSEPEYLLKVRNGGRRAFFLNNARVISPNICAGLKSSIRCHGISAALAPWRSPVNAPTSPDCPAPNSPLGHSSPPPPLRPIISPNSTPTISGQPSGSDAWPRPEQSGSSRWVSCEGVIGTVAFSALGWLAV